MQQRQSCTSGRLGGRGQCWVPHTEEGLQAARERPCWGWVCGFLPCSVPWSVPVQAGPVGPLVCTTHSLGRPKPTLHAPGLRPPRVDSCAPLSQAPGHSGTPGLSLQTSLGTVGVVGGSTVGVSPPGACESTSCLSHFSSPGSPVRLYLTS